MTLIDIYYQIINYDLTNLSKDLIIPGFKLIVIFVVGFLLITCLFFFVKYIFSELLKTFKRL